MVALRDSKLTEALLSLTQSLTSTTRYVRYSHIDLLPTSITSSSHPLQDQVHKQYIQLLMPLDLWMDLRHPLNLCLKMAPIPLLLLELLMMAFHAHWRSCHFQSIVP
jgi:hypothetical protein